MTKVIHGNESGEQLVVTADKTQAYGLAGNDTLDGGDDNDKLLGGKGFDTFEFTYSATKALSAVIEDFDPSADKIVVNFVGTSAPRLSSNTSGNNDYFDGDAPEQVWEEIKGLDQIGALSNHKRPDGSNYSTVIVDVEKNLSLSAKYSAYGENLDAGAKISAKVMSDWIGSLSHHGNILDSDKHFSKFGVGYLYDNSSGRDYYWTQLFAGNTKSSAEKVTVKTADLLKAKIQTNAVTKIFSLSDADNPYENTNYGAIISGTSSADSISNTGALVSIAGGSSADTIENY